MPDMEREQILEAMDRLPAIPPYKIPEDPEIFEGVENGATFMVTKHYLDPKKDNFYLALSISGDQSGKERLIADFSQVLGKPFTNNPHPINPHVQILSWLIEPNAQT